jgi:hypothetical protein
MGAVVVALDGVGWFIDCVADGGSAWSYGCAVQESASAANMTPTQKLDWSGVRFET